MKNINLKNQSTNFDSTEVLEDYEIEIVKKISFWANLIYKIKNHKEQKLLPSGNTKQQRTFQSINYMWNLNRIRNSLFNTLDNIKSVLIPTENTTSKNSLTTEIISQEHSEKTKAIENTQVCEQKETVIIPKPISSKLNTISNNIISLDNSSNSNNINN